MYVHRGLRRRDLKMLGEGLLTMNEDREFQIGILNIDKKGVTMRESRLEEN